ncbi:MAG: ABC transporter substrate-binding protein [Pseudomonadota bacterium]|jgi:ABC-type nitrate/sulfonate/bicarbonate transport system substrate-binding protein
MPRTLWYTRCPVATASGIAFQRQSFDEEFDGTDFRVRNIKELGREKADTHFDHSLADSFREGGAIPPLWARTRGADTLAVGLTFVADSLATFVRADDPATRVQDLAGRRFGLPVRPYILIDFMKVNAHKGFYSTLLANGMQESDARFVEMTINDDMHGSINADLKQGDRPSLYDADVDHLLRGEVDVIFCKNAEVGLIERRYRGRIRKLYDLMHDQTDRAHMVNANPRIITVSAGLAREAPEAVERYLQVLVRTANWAAGHPAEATAALAAELGVTADDIRNTYEPGFHQKLWPSFGAETRRLLQVQIDFMQSHGYLGPVDLESWMQPRFLEQAYRREGLPAVA